MIGGTGIQSLDHFTQVASLNVETPWGTPSSPIAILHHPSPTSGKEIPIAFLSRHGLHHELAPHEVPARANIAALRKIGVRTIIAFSAVGSLQEHIKPRVRNRLASFSSPFEPTYIRRETLTKEKKKEPKN